MPSASIVEQIVISVLPSTIFIVSKEETFQNFVDKSFENQCMKNPDGTSALTILTEHLHEHSSSDLHKFFKLWSGNDS